jgi:hypothetical protein
LEEDGLARTQSPGLHGGEGEGEEDEETTYTVKAKVFKFTTYKEEAPAWSEMGIGGYLYYFSLLAHIYIRFVSLVCRHASSQETQRN